MQLKTASWQEVENYLKHSDSIIVPIGSIEQHGPTGLLGTDALCPEIIAEGIAKQSDILVAPTISYGVAQHHLGFAGTMAVRPTTMIAIIKDVVLSLAKHGFKHIFFLNGHGGNTATIQAAFSELYSEYSYDEVSAMQSVRCTAMNWWEAKGIIGLSRKLHGNDEGRHATPAEIALTYYAYPDAVKKAALNPQVAPVGNFTHCDDFRKQFADGRIGSDPSCATPETGKQLFELAVSGVIESYRNFIGTEEVVEA